MSKNGYNFGSFKVRRVILVSKCAELKGLSFKLSIRTIASNKPEL